MNPIRLLGTWIRRVTDHLKAIEIALIAALLWWAFILAMPFNTFDHAIAYQAMKEVASEEVWSGIFLVIALVSIHGVVTERYLVRVIGLILSTGLWIFVSAMFAISDLTTTGTGIYFIVACLNIFVVYKVGEQRGR